MTAPVHADGKPAYRRDIDGLRALAILAVVGFHAFPAWMTGGYVGVDIFFVISGFLITGILLDHLTQGQFSLVGFYANRVRRIFPALILVLTATLAFGAVVLWPDEFRHLGRHIAGGAGFVINFVLCTETGYFQEKVNVQPTLHLWSLAIEEQFYIFWPLLLALAWRCHRCLRTLFAFGLGASFLFSLYLIARDPVADFYSPLSRFWELLTGGALAYAARIPNKGIYARLDTRLARESAAALGLALAILAILTFRHDTPFPGAAALVPVASAVLLIAAGSETFVNRRLLANPVAVGIGLISYPLYLWHWPLLSYTHILSGGAPSRELRMGMVIAAFALATLTMLYIERPIRSRRLSPARAVLLIGSLATLGALGGTAYFSGGWPSRYDQAQVRALSSEKLIDAWQKAVRVGTCHLQDTTASAHAPSCVEEGRPSLFLWGDSHAATLYPGLAALQTEAAAQDRPFAITQMTVAGCPPLLDIPQSLFRQNCNALNRRIVSDIARLQPDAILLAAAWEHEDYPMTDAEVAARLEATLRAIRDAAPQAHLILVGPTPHWTATMPAIYRRALSFARATPPAVMKDFLVASTPALDALLRGVQLENGFTYLSPQEYLCSAQGCLTRLGDGLDSLAYNDAEHLTPQASIWLVHHFAAQIDAALYTARRIN